MHEMSICESLLQIIEQSAATEGFRAVRRVRLEVGGFAGVETEALRFGFDVVTRGSVAEGAALEILETPGVGYCFDCEKSVPLEERLSPCPSCGGGKISPTGGDELRIKDMEVA